MSEPEPLNVLKVVASRIDRDHIFYDCPFCFKTNRKNSKPKVHFHSNDGDYSNRIEERISHCQVQGGFIDIIINDTTRRPFKSGRPCANGDGRKQWDETSLATPLMDLEELLASAQVKEEQNKSLHIVLDVGDKNGMVLTIQNS